jgi:hypothetical protein
MCHRVASPPNRLVLRDDRFAIPQDEALGLNENPQNRKTQKALILRTIHAKHGIVDSKDEGVLTALS